MNAWTVRGACYELDGPGWQAKAWQWRASPSRIVGRFVVRRMPGAILLHQGEARDVTDAMVAAERLARGEAHG